MKDCSYIINEVCTGAKSPAAVKQMIPVLVSWAKRHETHHTYRELNTLLGYTKGCQAIGHFLGCVKLVFVRLSQETGEEIPTLNALVTNQKNGLPSDGFNYVYPNYDQLDDEGKKLIAKTVNQIAFEYKNWDWVLASLGLKPFINNEDIESIRSGGFGFGGESEAHKHLKEYIASHPKSIGLKSKAPGENEYILLSGDRLDVYFPLQHLAVEVKSSISSDADILRGIFQCVKYQSVLDAEAALRGEKTDSRTLLVIEGTLSQSNRNAADCLNVDVIENFKY